MLFNSFTFAIFLCVVFAAFWSIPQRLRRTRNMLLLVASYVFYGWWDWRFLALIFVSSLVDFFVGLRLAQTERQAGRRLLLSLSLAVNLGMLAAFKYFNFFAASLAAVFSALGMRAGWTDLNIILPVGISFYTFQTLSYTIDIYRRQLEPTRDVVAFFAFVSFFPQLVAGPIERASHLLPQFLSPRAFHDTRARDGLRMMLWGLFKKTVVADNLAPIVDVIFANTADQSAATLWVGIFYFSMQIYCDFSGYSDIAIGTARLFGFDLSRNFATPYFARDVGEFWRRWHMSLSTWFRDYVYIPLGGNRTSRPRYFFNLFATFTLSGLWHGANWTFVVWGALHGLFYLPLVFGKRSRQATHTIAQGGWFPSRREVVQLSVTSLAVLLAWVFFRADSITHALQYLRGMFTYTSQTALSGLLEPLPFALGMLLMEWLHRERPHSLEISDHPVWVRWAIYYVLVLIIWIYRAGGAESFIYFQF